MYIYIHSSYKDNHNLEIFGIKELFGQNFVCLNELATKLNGK